MTMQTVVDRRVRPEWNDRRGTRTRIPITGLHPGQVARARQGRRATDALPPAVEHRGDIAIGSTRLGRFATYES